MQDNAGLKDRKLIIWPPASPDLNPILRIIGASQNVTLTAVVGNIPPKMNCGMVYSI